MKSILAEDMTSPPSLILPLREEMEFLIRTGILPHSRSHFRSEKEEQVYLRRLRLRLTRRKSRRMSQEIEKQNENEEQKESLDKTAKALSFCGPTWDRTKHLLIMSQLL